MSCRSSAIALYRRALRVATKCPRPEQADFVRAAVRNGFSDNSRLSDSRAILAAVKAGHAELDSMEVLHALYVQRQAGATSPDMTAAIADMQRTGSPRSHRARDEQSLLAESPCSAAGKANSTSDGPLGHTDCTTDDLVRLTRAVLCAAAGDREVFHRLCHAQMTSFSEQARGHLLTGLAFHEHDFGAADPSVTETLLEPRVRFLGDHAAIALAIRLVRTGRGRQTSVFEETCVWERDASGRWWLVHWHRSGPETART
jgi:hypothetical protein